MRQPYSIDGRELTRGFAPIANPTHVGAHAQPIPTHLFVPKHASSSTIAGFDNKVRLTIHKSTIHIFNLSLIYLCI
jgi:hypothetical protein